ncbi:MAG: redoxin family protein [Polyangiaceae bacterium]
MHVLRHAAPALFACVSCVASGRPPALTPSVPLVSLDGTTRDARAVAARAPITVFIFFSAHCHCLDAHEARLRAIFDAYASRGVQFVMVDSEVMATPEADAVEAQRRGYRFPILLDRRAMLADALGAEYATYTVVVDSRGSVFYRGGLDSDKQHLHNDAKFYLRDALDDLLAGHRPRHPEGKTLGCALVKS